MKNITNDYLNNFGNQFNQLPLELQKEIILQNANYYQQIVANLLLQYNRLKIEYNNRYNDYKDIQSPHNFMSYYLEVYENKNKKFNKQQTKNAYEQLNNYYKPLIMELRKELQILKKQVEDYKKEIEINKKQYYYYYQKYKKIN